MGALGLGGGGFNIGNLLSNLSLGPDALAPAIGAPVPAIAGGSTINLGDISISLAGVDTSDPEALAREVASQVDRVLQDQIEDLVADYDGPIVR